MRFTLTDPRSAGLAGGRGDTVHYVVDGVATHLFRYGAGDTDWCTLPREGAAEPVTSDPRTGLGLDRPVGARVLYVAANLGLMLVKYGAGTKDWATARGMVPAPSDTTSFYRSDGVWAAPSVPAFGADVGGTVPASGGFTDRLLQSDGTWITPDGLGGGAATVTAATLALGATAKCEHRITVTDAAVSPTSKIQVGWGATLDTDANGPDMDAVSFAARPGAGSFVVLVTCAQPIAGDVKALYTVGA